MGKINENSKYLHISSAARKNYSISPDYFSIHGNVIIAGFAQARILAEQINAKRREDGRNDFTTPGILNAAALLHELFHYLIEKYEQETNPGVFKRALQTIRQIDNSNFEKLISEFVEKFPPKSVLIGQQTVKEYLNSQTGLKSNVEIVTEEILLLYLENINPALRSIQELFDDSELKQKTGYLQVIEASKKFFQNELPIGNPAESLFDFLQKPLIAHPDNIDLQLKYILNTWQIELLDLYKLKILGSTDLIYEDSKLFIKNGEFSGGTPAPEYKTLSIQELNFLKEQYLKGEKPAQAEDPALSHYFEPEQFTEDLDWMPKVVLLAKNVFVWLDQLTKKYGRHISKLHEIPDSELDVIAESNFNALWLIGVWERSNASKKIKQFCGNHDAVASAYSLYDYEIAHALGGRDSFDELKHRCQIRGIRMASDMVPNHTGIFSKCLLEHPDYFIQSMVPPFPGYTFTGPDLSENPAYQIRIEDKYYSKSDASVVFELRENYTGKVRYIYHGNDGTVMPWNDTAQFNLLNPEVRHYLADQIKKVASMFPIIRFDAAMTLTNKHYQRLWFPQPGLAGAIPSRADYSMTRETYNTMMPTEFWRDIVEQMTNEMPNTLLLAEAFWLMEGYFVRTLGMHRVYNSAFMHMFMKEENAEFKKLIKNTLEFNPEILKRYVNFMSNPDEETAINQFGKGDKYFGVCTMLITLPGLPMFAHGQIEGFTEKYGMEYQRAYYNETPDQYLVERHKKEIFPLLQKRYLFSEVQNFWLYDFVDEDNVVNDNVIAFSNASGSEKTLVLYNNSYAQCSGNIKIASGKVLSDAQNAEGTELISSSVSDALFSSTGSEVFYICKESIKNLEHLFYSTDISEEGYNCTLKGYECRVFHSFREVHDIDGSLHALYAKLQGNGITSVEDAVWEKKAEGLHARLLSMLNSTEISALRDFTFSSETLTKEQYRHEVDTLTRGFSMAYDELAYLQDSMIEKDSVIKELQLDILAFRTMNTLLSKEFTKKQKVNETISLLHDLIYPEANIVYKDLALTFLMFNRLLSSMSGVTAAEVVEIYKRLHISKQLWQNLIRLNSDYQVVRLEFELLESLIAESQHEQKLFHMPAFSTEAISPRGRQSLSKKYIESLLQLPSVLHFIGFNIYQGVEYFNKERFEQLIKWNLLLSLYDYVKEQIASTGATGDIDSAIKKINSSRNIKLQIASLTEWAQTLISIADESGFRFRNLTDQISNSAIGITKKTIAKKEVVKTASTPKAAKAKNVTVKAPKSKKNPETGKTKKRS